MSHPFGDLLSQHLHRKHGLSQAKLAAGILQAPAIITFMCKGERLTGPQARERVLAIIGWLNQQGVLSKPHEANALLLAAGLAPPRDAIPTEAALLHQIANQSTNARAALTTTQNTPSVLVSPEFDLVGRQAEWQTLRAAWHTAMQGAAHLVCITGDAGIGKTRLAEELLADAQCAGYPVARTRAYALEGRLAYAPVADWLRSHALMARVRALPAVWRTELARLLPELLIEDVALPPQPLTERWQVKRLFEALLQAISSAAQQAPLLLVLDDLQWCDPETLEWVQYVLSAAPHLKLLIAGTVRDTEVDADHPLHKLWRALLQEGQLTQLPLMPLSQAETARLGAAVLQRPLDAPVADRLFNECAGNPLFVIESVRFQHNESSQPPVALAPQRNGLTSLPPKVYAVIQASLDRLSPTARAVVEVAAVAGRAVTLPLLVRASRWDEAQAVQGLDELLHKRLVREQGGAHLDFSHDRIRDVAYAEISPIKRSLLHRAVAQTLESLQADHLDAIAGELAGHYQQASDLERALAYFRQAAAVAEQLYAHHEVVRYLERAIAVAQMKPDKPEFRAAEIDLWKELGVARTWVYGFGSEQAGAAWSEVHTLAMQTGTAMQRAQALISLAGFASTRGEWRKCLEYDQQALPLVENSGDKYLIASSLCIYGRSLFHAGELDSALIYFRRALGLADATVQPLLVRKWNALKDSTLIRIAQCLWLLGFPDQAHTTSQEIIENIHTRVDVFDSFAVFDFCAMLNTYGRNADMVRRLSEKLTELSNKHDFSFFLCAAGIYQGWALAQLGDAQTGARIVQEAFSDLRRHGSRMFEPYHRTMLAEPLALTGEYKEALDEVDAGLAFANETGNVYWNAHLLKLKGDFVQALGAPDSEAEAWYQRALSLARAQSARSLELRAGVALARLWQKQGHCTQACQLLAPIYGWFTEGFDTPDLKEASALLSELA